MLLLKNPWTHLRWKGRYSEMDTASWTPQLQSALNYDPLGAQQFDDGESTTLCAHVCVQGCFGSTSSRFHISSTFSTSTGIRRYFRTHTVIIRMCAVPSVRTNRHIRVQGMASGLRPNQGSVFGRRQSAICAVCACARRRRCRLDSTHTSYHRQGALLTGEYMLFLNTWFAG
jgi:hypothetical protein